MQNNFRGWSDYWQAGKFSTFGGLDDLSVNPSIVSLWEKYVGNKIQRNVLEVGCGNGALTQIVDLVAEKSGCPTHVFAIDAADIVPTDSVSDRVSFFPNTPMETLPFDDNFFDFAVSQFGFEYADPSTAITELSRVLKPEAGFTMIAHHKSSLICRESFDTLRELIRIEESAILVAAEALVSQLEIVYLAKRDPSRDAKAERYRNILNKTAEELRDAATSGSVQDRFTLLFLDSLFKVFNKDARDGLSHKQYIARMSDSLYAYKYRLMSQKEAAMDDDEWSRYLDLWTSKGFVIEKCEPAVLNGYHFGTMLSGVYSQ